MCQAEVLVASHQESYTNSLSGQKPAILFQFLDVDTEGTGSSHYTNATQQSTRTSRNKREIHLALLSFCKRAGSWLLSDFCSMLWWVLYSFAILSNTVCRSEVANTDAIRSLLPVCSTRRCCFWQGPREVASSWTCLRVRNCMCGHKSWSITCVNICTNCGKQREGPKTSKTW